MNTKRAKWVCAGVCALAASLQAATVERVFRPERYSRGDTNVRVQQPIDEASWIWAKGCDVWGGAVFSDTRTDPATLAKMPQSFFRFRREFTSSGEPLEIDVSADERFVMLVDGKDIARGPMRGLPNRWHYESYRVTGLEPGEFVHTFGDAHIYLNHMDQVHEQLSREPRPLPRMVLNPKVKSIFDYDYDDFRLEGYDPWPLIKGVVSV